MIFLLLSDFMNNEMKELIAQFNKIVGKRWIPSVNKGLGSAGLLLIMN